MPRAKTHNAKKISPYSLHVCVACGYKCAPLCTMYFSRCSYSTSDCLPFVLLLDFPASLIPYSSMVPL